MRDKQSILVSFVARVILAIKEKRRIKKIHKEQHKIMKMKYGP